MMCQKRSTSVNHVWTKLIPSWKLVEKELELVHSNKCGKSSSSLSHAECFVVFPDDKTHCVQVYAIKHWSFSEGCGMEVSRWKIVWPSGEAVTYRQYSHRVQSKESIKHLKTPEQNGTCQSTWTGYWWKKLNQCLFQITTPVLGWGPLHGSLHISSTGAPLKPLTTRHHW